MTMRLVTMLSLVVFCTCQKVLVISPLFGYSHSNFFATIADSLSEAGLNVTVLQPILNTELIGKIGYRHVKDVRSIDATEEVQRLWTTFKRESAEQMWMLSPSPMVIFEIFKSALKASAQTADVVLGNKTLIEELKSEKYDVAIAEPMLIHSFAVMDAIGVKSTAIALSVSNMESISNYIGEPNAYSYVPGAMSTTSDEMSFFQRFTNLAQGLFIQHMFENNFKDEIDVIRRHLPDFSTPKGNIHGTAVFETVVYKNRSLKQFFLKLEVFSKCAYVFTNSNPYIDFPRPLLSKTVQIGGITIDRTKSSILPHSFEEILRQRNKAVLLSFGTLSPSYMMPLEYKLALLESFGSFPEITFIWKYEEKTDIASNFTNVILTPWIPQKELLADHRVHGFITHAGLGSSMELAYSGKPAIVVPLFGDQMRNANMLKRHGSVVLFEKKNLNDVELLKDAIAKLLNDERIRTNAKRLGELLENEPVDRRIEFIKHIQFLARFTKLDQLDAHGRNLSIIQYYLIDVLVFIAGCFIIVTLLTFIAVRLLYFKMLRINIKSKSD